MDLNYLKNGNKSAEKVEKKNEISVEFDSMFDKNSDIKDEISYIDFNLELNKENQFVKPDLPNNRPSTITSDNINMNYQKILFKKYRYREFSPSEARDILFKDQNCPTCYRWNAFIRLLESKSIISRMLSNKKIFRFNLKERSKENYIDFYYILNNFKMIINRKRNKEASLPILLQTISVTKKPDEKDFKKYIKDLEEDGIMVLTRIRNKIKFYKIGI